MVLIKKPPRIPLTPLIRTKGQRTLTLIRLSTFKAVYYPFVGRLNVLRKRLKHFLNRSRFITECSNSHLYPFGWFIHPFSYYI